MFIALMLISLCMSVCRHSLPPPAIKVVSRYVGRSLKNPLLVYISHEVWGTKECRSDMASVVGYAGFTAHQWRVDCEVSEGQPQRDHKCQCGSESDVPKGVYLPAHSSTSSIVCLQ